jgi:hypothetical protein
VRCRDRGEQFGQLVDELLVGGGGTGHGGASSGCDPEH